MNSYQLVYFLFTERNNADSSGEEGDSDDEDDTNRGQTESHDLVSKK